jgi:hypothetical protein
VKDEDERGHKNILFVVQRKIGIWEGTKKLIGKEQAEKQYKNVTKNRRMNM